MRRSCLVLQNAALAETREYWVAAVPVTWNIVPNGRDAIMGMEYGPADTVMGTAVYRRFTRKIATRKNLYGDGHAANRILKILEAQKFPLPITKQFHDD